jgi:uridine kinase
VTDSTKPNEPILLGVAGGSGSGKTYFAQELQKKFGTDLCEIVYQDNFYIDQSKKFDKDGGAVNFDHPDAIDFETLAQALTQLKSGKKAQIPIYDFVNHARKKEMLTVHPKRLVIVDGILIFHAEKIRDLLDYKVFFNTPEDLRLIRRLQRDVKERGRTPEGVHAQFVSQVKPMHDRYVEPSAVFASTVITDLGDFQESYSSFETLFEKLLKT